MAISLHRIFWLLIILVSLNVIVVCRRIKQPGEIKWNQDCPHYQPRYFKYPHPFECFRRYSYGSSKYDENGINSRIYGGQATKAGTWPQFVRVYTSGSGGTTGCGGTILTDQIILTAAHCVADNKADYIRVILASGPDEFNAIGRMQYCPHPIYESDNWIEGEIENDIAFIILETPLEFSQDNRQHFAPVCLPTKRDYYPANKALGMGPINGHHDFPTTPIELTVFREDQDRCYFKYNYEYIPQDRVGCYLSWHNQPGTTCAGDSGGPIFDAVGEQIGLIVAGNLGCNMSATLDPFLAIDTCDQRRGILKVADICYHEVTKNFKLSEGKLKLRHDIVLE